MWHCDAMAIPWFLNPLCSTRGIPKRFNFGVLPWLSTIKSKQSVEKVVFMPGFLKFFLHDLHYFIALTGVEVIHFRWLCFLFIVFYFIFFSVLSLLVWYLLNFLFSPTLILVTANNFSWLFLVFFYVWYENFSIVTKLAHSDIELHKLIYNFLSLFLRF